MQIDKMEIIYYELKKMEKVVSEKAQILLDAENKISENLVKFEALQKELIKKMENK